MVAVESKMPPQRHEKTPEHISQFFRAVPVARCNERQNSIADIAGVVLVLLMLAAKPLDDRVQISPGLHQQGGKYHILLKALTPAQGRRKSFCQYRRSPRIDPRRKLIRQILKPSAQIKLLRETHGEGMRIAGPGR